MLKFYLESRSKCLRLSKKIKGKVSINAGLIVFLLQTVDELLRQTGKPWTVPWTAETILQVSLIFLSNDIVKF